MRILSHIKTKKENTMKEQEVKTEEERRGSLYYQRRLKEHQELSDLYSEVASLSYRIKEIMEDISALREEIKPIHNEQWAMSEDWAEEYENDARGLLPHDDVIYALADRVQTIADSVSTLEYFDRYYMKGEKTDSVYLTQKAMRNTTFPAQKVIMRGLNIFE